MQSLYNINRKICLSLLVIFIDGVIILLVILTCVIVIRTGGTKGH